MGKYGIFFFGCSNLTYTATDNPNLTNVTSLSSMFNSCLTFNGDIGSWDVINITDMSNMFLAANDFNQDINGWDVSNVLNMRVMFRWAHFFNQNLDNWDVSEVRTMWGMFNPTDSFNGDITTWDVSKVTDMRFMFNQAAAFNQNIGNWNIANLQWLPSFYRTAMDIKNYDQTLIGWASQNVQNNRGLDARDLKYCNGESARDILVNTFGWSINGDQKECSDCTLEGVSIALDSFGLANIDTSLLNLSPFGIHDTVYILNDNFMCDDISSSPILDSIIGITGTDTTICTFEVTIMDTLPPCAECSPDTAYLNANGSIIVLGSEVLDTVYDNCGVDFISARTFDCSDLGENVMTIGIEDINDNGVLCNATITVLDTIKPIPDCSDVTIYLDSNGTYSLSSTDSSMIVGNPSDNCFIDSVEIEQLEFSCTDLPSVEVGINIWDQSYNLSTCIVTVTVLDTLAPVLNCADISIDLDVGGVVSINAQDLQFETDNCIIDTMYLSQSIYTCADMTGDTEQDSLEEVGSFDTENNFINGITYHNGLIYLTKRPIDSVLVYNTSGQFQFGFGGSGTSGGLFGEPNAVVLDSDGNIYVSDRFNAKILKFDNSGVFISQFNTTAVEDIYMYQDILYACHDDLNKVSAYQLDGTFIRDVLTHPKPASIDIKNDKIYVVNNANNATIGVYDLQGNLLLTKAVNGWANNIGADDNGNIYLLAWNDTKYIIYDSEGNILEEVFPPFSEAIYDISIVGSKTFTTDLYGNIREWIVPSGAAGQQRTLTVIDASGNESTCSFDISITDTHGYCCPDSLVVNYQPIDSTDYYAAKEIQATGQIASTLPVNFRSTSIIIDSLCIENGSEVQMIIEECSNGLCDHPDYDALIAFYNSTGGPDWKDNSGWVDGALGIDCDVCTWYGVDCDVDGRVRRIDMDGQPDEINHGGLGGNNLQGMIPSEISFLANLEVLTLSDNSGLGSSSIPMESDSWPSLRSYI